MRAQNTNHPLSRCECHGCPDGRRDHEPVMSRRSFLAAAAAGGAALSHLTWARLAPAVESVPMPPARQPLKVLPILVWDHPQRAPMRSWRHWGGIATPEQAAEEAARIRSVAAADAILLYGAGSGVNGAQELGKDVILFQRHRSGPLYLQYEIISPRFCASIRTRPPSGTSPPTTS